MKSLTIPMWYMQIIQGLTQIRYAGLAWLLQTLIFNSFIYK